MSPLSPFGRSVPVYQKVTRLYFLQTRRAIKGTSIPANSFVTNVYAYTRKSSVFSDWFANNPSVNPRQFRVVRAYMGEGILL